MCDTWAHAGLMVLNITFNCEKYVGLCLLNLRHSDGVKQILDRDVDRDSNADIVFVDGQNVYVQTGPLPQMMRAPHDLKFALDAMPMPMQMNLSDVNGDAILDLIVLRKRGIAVYLGHGNGDFQKSAWVDNVADELALADLDGSCQPGLVLIEGENVRLLSHPSGR